VVTDTASNVKKAFTLCDDVNLDNADESPDEGDDAEPVQIMFEQESEIQLSRISCFAHTLQLVIKDGYPFAALVAD